MGDLFTPLHLIIILAILLIIFGPRRLPELGSGLGKAISGFRKATTDPQGLEQTVVEATSEAPQRPQGDRNTGGPTAV